VLDQTLGLLEFDVGWLLLRTVTGLRSLLPTSATPTTWGDAS